MSGLPFPVSNHKWVLIQEARHPLIQDLIKIWEESPGYILPQNSFIKDKARLENFIDALIELERNRLKVPLRPVKDQAPESDPNWEKNLMKALSSAAVATPKPAEKSSIPKINLTELKIPGLEEKFAKLKEPVVDLLPEKAVNQRPTSLHLIFLYAISLSAFALACYAIKY